MHTHAPLWRIIIQFALLPLLLVGCATTQADEKSTATNLGRAEARWREQGVDSYTISVEVATLWHVQVNHVTVERGAVVAAHATCGAVAPLDFKARDTGRCATEQFNGADFTVEGLFARARAAASATSPEVETSFTFDPERGFPSTMGGHNKAATDSSWSWRVVAFTTP